VFYNADRPGHFHSTDRIIITRVPSYCLYVFLPNPEQTLNQ